MSTATFAAVRSAPRAITRADYDRYLPLVRRVAMRIARRVPGHIGVAELVSYGWLGMVEALSRADESLKPEQFEAYALHRVQGAILDYLRSLDPQKRKLRTASRRVARAIHKLTGQLSRPPEEQEIATEMGLSLNEYHELLAGISHAGMARLEMVDLDEADPMSDADMPDEAAGRRLLASAVAEAIERLPPRLRTVLSLYYQHECTLREIGAVLGVTESRVCQLHSEAMHRLRADIGRE